MALQGSIDAAMARLDEYRGRLESRIIERYDAAVVGGMLTTMAQCARIMAEFQRGEETCVQVHTPNLAYPLTTSERNSEGWKIEGVNCVEEILVLVLGECVMQSGQTDVLFAAAIYVLL